MLSVGFFIRSCLRFLVLLLAAGATVTRVSADTIHLLTVSYDPTRELYEEFNQAFAKDYLAKTGKQVVIEQSHGGSGKQARSVIDGLEADVVTLGLAADIDALHDNGNLVAADWQTRSPPNTSPYPPPTTLLLQKPTPKRIKH